MSYVGNVTADGSTHLVGSTLYGTCATAAATAAKVVTCANFDHLLEGVTIHVKFTYNNTSSAPTMNVNGTGAKNIVGGGTVGGVTYVPEWHANRVVSFTYDGTNWVMNDYYYVDTNTKNTAGSTNSTSKLFLVGATSQAASPQTYSNSSVYATAGALHATTFNGYTLAAASAKGVDTSISSGSTSANLPTTAAVASYVATQMGDVAGALVYKGTATSETAITDTAYKKGWYWIVAMPDSTTTSITIAGQTCEAGDMVIARQAKTSTVANDLDIVQTNTERITNAEIDTIVAS